MVALYMRLSVDDRRVESMSIETQREILQNYAQTLNEEKIEILEFVDNGYSGTNFERPAVQELIAMVQALKINCIIVKDFSRFGRNSIEVGYFTEQVFPLFNVRFISVSDYFDSNDHTGDTGGMEVAFKYLINEYYSRDLSVKSKSAKLIKMRNGEYTSQNYCYGYTVGENKEMVIDEFAANVVRMIFELSCEGKSLIDIITILYEKNIPSPAVYKKMNGKGNNYDTTRCQRWQRSTVSRILSDEQYIGTFVMCKFSVADVGSHHSKKNDESEWIKIPNHHPAIISKEMFDKAQGRRKFHLQGKRREHIYPLKSKVICGCCEHTMQKLPRLKPIFRCLYSRYNRDSECYNMTLTENELEQTLFDIISKQAQVIANIDNLNDLDNIQLQTEKVIEIEKQIRACNDEKQRLYEQLLMREITLDRYNTDKDALNKKADELKKQYKSSSHRAEQMQMESSKKAELIQMAKDISKETTLTQTLADLLIDKVYVYPDNRIEVDWKIRDFCIDVND